LNYSAPEHLLPDWWPSWADVRLFISAFGGFLIVVAILMYTGYSQLYNANPTFGASIFDWAGLFLWGLMAGPSADAI